MKRLLLLALLCATRLEAQVLDVQTPMGAGIFGQLTKWQAQSVTTTADSLLGAGFYLFASSGQGELSGDLEIRVYDGLASDGGTLLGSGTTTYALDARTGGWFDVFFEPVAVTPSSTLWVYLLGTQTHGETIYTRYSLHSYAGGHTVSVGSSTITDVGITDWSSADLTVRTWKTTPPTPVPEPSTLALVAIGAALLMRQVRAIGRGRYR